MRPTLGRAEKPWLPITASPDPVSTTSRNRSRHHRLSHSTQAFLSGTGSYQWRCFLTWCRGRHRGSQWWGGGVDLLPPRGVGPQPRVFLHPPQTTAPPPPPPPPPAAARLPARPRPPPPQ